MIITLKISYRSIVGFAAALELLKSLMKIVLSSKTPNHDVRKD